MNRLLDRIEPPSQDLSPSQGVSQLLNLLRDVLSGGHIVDAQPSDVCEVPSTKIEWSSSIHQFDSVSFRL